MAFYPPSDDDKTPPTEKDFNPDHHSSESGLFVTEKDESIIYVLRVLHLGALVMRASCDDKGCLIFDGVSMFTESEING